jgi:hypothetical protein
MEKIPPIGSDWSLISSIILDEVRGDIDRGCEDMEILSMFSCKKVRRIYKTVT